MYTQTRQDPFEVSGSCFMSNVKKLKYEERERDRYYTIKEIHDYLTLQKNSWKQLRDKDSDDVVLGVALW